MFNSNKGYSLVEIGVGILILTVFLLVSLGMFSGAYNNYRRIKQRNMAVTSAVTQIETMLQMDANELTGFYSREINPSTGKYELMPCDVLIDYVENQFSPENAVDFINKNPSEYINDYIHNRLKNGYESATEEELSNGEYGFIAFDDYLNRNVYSNQKVTTLYYGTFNNLADSQNYVTSNSQPIKTVRTVRRIPSKDGILYGNEVLKLKVEVFYSDKFGTNVSDEDLKSIVIETVKVTKTTK